jgi:D-amino-acid dehydrogenase
VKVIVLGAGIIGTASAWFLNKAGHEVTVIDRQPGAALETSFANGGQISVSHAEPWANPAAPWKLLQWLGREDAPLLYRFRAEWLQWKWGMHFMRECSAARTAANIRQIIALAEYSRQVLQAVRVETAIEYDCATRGILHFYTDQREFDHAVKTAAMIREFGCPRTTVDPAQVIGIEPALAHMRDRIVGGDFTATDESGDIYKFTTALAAKAADAGVAFEFNATVTRLIPQGAGAASTIRAVEIIDAQGRHRILHADAFVVAMGSFSVPLLKPLGIDLLI